MFRLGLACHRLMFMQARGDTKLQPLIDVGFLLEDEADMLRDRPAKALLVWAW